MAHRDPKKEIKGKTKSTVRERPKKAPYKRPKDKNWLKENKNQ